MKKTILALLSIALLLASILGAPSKGPKPRRPADAGDRPDRVLWV